MRTWVIWHRNPYVGVAVLASLVVFWTPVFYFLAVALNSLVCESLLKCFCMLHRNTDLLSVTTAPNPNTPGCFLLTQKNILFVVYILITSFESREFDQGYCYTSADSLLNVESYPWSHPDPVHAKL